MFFSGRKKKAQKELVYSSLTALYFGEPVYENVRAVIHRPERKLELCFSSKSYILDLNRLTAEYHSDLCTAFLAQGRRCFGEYWQEIRPVLEGEQQKRASSAEGKLRPKEGIALQYRTKEETSILVLLVSDVFLEITHMMSDLQEILPEIPRPRIEL